MRHLLLAVLLCAPAARAEDSAALAVQVAKALTPPERYQGMLEQLYRPLLANAEKAQTDRQKLEEAAARIRAASAKALPYDDLVAWTAEVYAAHFSAAELKALLKFFESPAGKKFNGLQPQINAELVQKVVAVYPKRFEAALKEE
jgi:hypothetical protein